MEDGRDRAALAVAAASALVGSAVFFGGGSGSAAVPWLAVALGAVLVVGAIAVAAGRLRLGTLDRSALVPALSLAVLVAWTGATMGWSIAGDRSWDALNKGLVYAGFLALGLGLGVLGPRTTRTAAGVLAAVLGLALVWALAGKALPVLFEDGGRAARLREPVGYWNGLALLADGALALGLWLATASPRSRAGRTAGAALVYAAVLVLPLTASRAGLLAVLAVVGLWLALSRERVEGALVALAAGVPAIAVAAWVYSRPALVEDGVARADRVSDGRVFGLLALAGLGLAVLLAARLVPARLEGPRRRRAARGVAALAGGLAAAGLVALLVAVGNPVTRAWDELSGDAEITNVGPERLTSLGSNNRTQWWSEAWEVWRDHPVAGAGAGTFEIARKRYREDATSVTEPHSVPLQLLAGQGAVGLSLLLLLAAAVVVGVRASVRRLDGPERAAAVGLLGLPLAYALHALVDYDLDFVALTGPLLFALGALLAAGASRAAPRRGWVSVLVVAALALAAAGSALSPALAERAVERSTVLLDEGRVGEAADEARTAQGLNPLSLEPLFARARAAERARAPRAAHELYERATGLQPENPESWYQLGIFRYLVLEDECGAYQALNEAYTLDPKSRVWTKGGTLDVVRDAVNAGACEGN